jgi:predicted  nucleic acid-binding Zn-ribbon protein
MADENHNLFELQKYDLSIFNIEDKENQIIKKLDEKLGIEDLNSKLRLIEEKFQDLTKLQIKVNQVIDQTNNEINQLNTTLYSGKIRNTKEVEAIEIEIKNKTELLASYEPKLIKVNENVTKLNGIKENYELKIFSLEEKWVDYEKKINSEIETLNSDRLNIQNKRKILSEKFDKNILNLYDSFIQKSRSVGISRLENRRSTCCKIELPNAFIEKIKNSELPIVCNCGKSLISE